MKKKPQRMRDTFLKWADPKRKDYFEAWMSEDLFVCLRLPKDFTFTWKYKKKK